MNTRIMTGFGQKCRHRGRGLYKLDQCHCQAPDRHESDLFCHHCRIVFSKLSARKLGLLPFLCGINSTLWHFISLESHINLTVAPFHCCYLSTLRTSELLMVLRYFFLTIESAVEAATLVIPKSSIQIALTGRKISIQKRILAQEQLRSLSAQGFIIVAEQILMQTHKASKNSTLDNRAPIGSAGIFINNKPPSSLSEEHRLTRSGLNLLS